MLSHSCSETEIVERATLSNSPRAQPAIPIKVALFVHQIVNSRQLLFSIINTTSIHSAASLACLPAHGPTHIPINILLSPLPPHLTSLHYHLPHTHSFPSRLPRPLPYALSSLTVRLCVLPHLKLPLVCSLARMTRPTLIRLTLPPPAPLPLLSCPSRRT
jgi:hypothetical protein